MQDVLDRLTRSRRLAPMVAHHRRVAGSPAAWRDPATPLPVAIKRALADRGIERLYRHQAEALDHAGAGRDVLAVTPTASGKTLIFALPVLRNALVDREARALFVYPTKALAQDQVAGLNALASSISPLTPPRFEIYDGDTTPHQRRKIKADPPTGLITNPDMLHFGILPHHADWQEFLGKLRFIVLDELHVYRGLFGAHVHHILRRLVRLSESYGGSPRFVATSATVGNPAEFARSLTGREFSVVDRSGAPTANRDVVFLNPHAVSPYTAAVRVIAETAGAGLRTIAFTKSRRVTELLHTWLRQQDPALARGVAPYRAGYLPEERRRIEARLFSGDLKAVITTSALELGIDVGGLDACVLVGYPGSLMSSWQRIGRVGRSARDALVVMIAMPDALDQYVIAHPDMFFGDAYERAVLDPTNPIVAGAHLVCAASERPLTVDEVGPSGGERRRLIDDLVGENRLAVDGAGDRWHSFRRRPHRDVRPRSSGQPFTILERDGGRVLGSIDGMRVYHECHPEAIYLHGGRSYRVVALDEDAREVRVAATSVDYYTAVLGEKETEILDRLETTKLGEFPVGLGRLRVTVRIRGYQKKRLFGGETISEHPLSAPPLIFETVGMWIEMPADWPAVFAERGLHFMGGIHAAEHAAIGLFPLLAIADRGDVGGISYTRHPQIERPAVFLYDGVAGGAGLAVQGYRDLRGLLRRTRDHVGSCGCDDGCPACIQSPRCGNGNKPLDKAACLLVLDAWLGDTVLDAPEDTLAHEHAAPDPSPGRHGIRRAPVESAVAGAVDSTVASSVAQPLDPPTPAAAVDGRWVVFDLETRRSADEVGGWGRIDRMGLALAVVYDVARDRYTAYREEDVDRLLLDLVMADRVVGFNIDRFDLRVLSAYTDQDLRRIRTLDMLQDVHARLGFRLSLQHLAEINLGESKSADGLQSLQWWREGRIDLIESYCRKDVEVTWRLFKHGADQGYLLYRDRGDRTLRLPVDWGKPARLLE